MQRLDIDCIGTHLQLQIDISSSCEMDFSHIGSYLRDFDLRYSRFIADNWLAHLNKNRFAILDEDARNMLVFALEIARETDGYFDPTVGKRLAELGYGNSILDISIQSEANTFGDYQDIEITGDQILLHGDIVLEFGGVGKGYLIDSIKNILEKYPRFLINFGGDLYGRGSWEVGLENPFALDEMIGTLMLEDDCLACSAGTKRKWGDYHHLIDPHTGLPATAVVATYIEGKRGILVDSYATALSVMPWNFACDIFAKIPDISGVIISKEGDIYQKQGSRAQIFT